MSDKEPEDKMPDVLAPFTEMAAAAIGMHELFMSYVNAGFTRAEALQMVMTMFTAFIQRPGDST